MLTILHPQVIPIIRDFRLGLLPVSTRGDQGRPVLAIKATKEILLAAKVNRGFKVYVSPIAFSTKNTIALISAFFDNEDEPMVIYTPLFNDDLTSHLIQILSHKSIDIHLFDEQNRELLAYESNLECPPATLDRLSSASFSDFDIELAKSAHDQMMLWFGTRSTEDDLATLKVAFGESLMPEDILIINALPEDNSFQGSPSFSFSQLERKEPGAFQEHDIANLMKNLFPAEQIMMNPLRITDHEEIADLLVITETDVMVIQAKDSPNVERVLKSPLSRKRLATKKALSKAISQTKGALRYLKSMSPLKLLVGGETIEIDIKERSVRALIIVKELFNDEYSNYSTPILELSKETHVPCIALDYPELQSYTTVLSSKESFFQAIDRVFTHGRETGMFPRLRLWRQ